LRAWGFAADIYGADISAAPAAGARPDGEYAAFGENDVDLLLYHYSAYCENYALFRASCNRKVLIYHNVTPPGFFSPYDAVYEALCRRGRELLGDLAECDWAAGVSEYNRQELVAAGFSAERTSVLPIFIVMMPSGTYVATMRCIGDCDREASPTWYSLASSA